MSESSGLLKDRNFLEGILKQLFIQWLIINILLGNQYFCIYVSWFI